MATAAVDNVEVMFLPKDIYDLPSVVCVPGGPPNGMVYLGPFLPTTTAVKADDAYWLTLHLISQYPGWIAPSLPVTTSSLLVAQPIVPDVDGSAIPSPRQSDNDNLGHTMNDWIDRPPPGGAVIGSWTFEQTSGSINHPDVTFTFEFALENDPRILTVDASLGDDYDKHDGLGDTSYVTGIRSYSVTLTVGSKSISVAASNPATEVPGRQPPLVMPDPHSFTTSDPTGTLLDLVVNVRWIDDNLFVVVTPKDFGDPAVPAPSPFGDDMRNPFGGR